MRSYWEAELAIIGYSVDSVIEGRGTCFSEAEGGGGGGGQKDEAIDASHLWQLLACRSHHLMYISVFISHSTILASSVACEMNMEMYMPHVEISRPVNIDCIVLTRKQQPPSVLSTAPPPTHTPTHPRLMVSYAGKLIYTGNDVFNDLPACACVRACRRVIDCSSDLAHTPCQGGVLEI